MRKVPLNDLVGVFGLTHPRNNGIEVTGISLDSRQVENGHIFVAIKGKAVDGNHFIPQAVQRGAIAVVSSEPVTDVGVPYFRVLDARFALAKLAAAFHNYPAKKMVVIGVTGTDGKTTTCNLIYEILRAAGKKVGMISTVNAIIDDEILDTGFHVTTPEAPEIQELLSRMVEKGLTHVIIETTSHGLEQKRVAECDFDFGVITNITHEHLDYHSSYEAYRNAKGLLFTSLSKPEPKFGNLVGGAVLNRDDSSYQYLSGITKVKQMCYGQSTNAEFQAQNVNIDESGLSFVVSTKFPDQENIQFPIKTVLIGEFNISNILAACSLTVGLMRLDPTEVQIGIANLKGIPGRMEKMDVGQDFLCFVDFAHTPNALQKTLMTSRKLVEKSGKNGKVITVFGSAGLRDKQKRRMMAEVSAKTADYTILTAEDPRTELLDLILSEMSEGMKQVGVIEGYGFQVISDRREAIRFAVRIARPGDVVVICGKGHEQSMCFGDIEYPWDDRTAVTSALCERMKLIGPSMPYLPTSEKKV